MLVRTRSARKSACARLGRRTWRDRGLEERGRLRGAAATPEARDGCGASLLSGTGFDGRMGTAGRGYVGYGRGGDRRVQDGFRCQRARSRAGYTSFVGDGVESPGGHGHVHAGGVRGSEETGSGRGSKFEGGGGEEGEEPSIRACPVSSWDDVHGGPRVKGHRRVFGRAGLCQVGWVRRVAIRYGARALEHAWLRDTGRGPVCRDESGMRLRPLRQTANKEPHSGVQECGGEWYGYRTRRD
ncbi:hypothetical protein B0H17DRAFT_5359 [Mycena rosella]|uniref:Uncharacterized protein n=1 Tax=Mycena rosella TaxID=1033263 RepID=A0AAD7H2S0_MYCRO|nr:hypothetical protein B0H17DRAFT_5359 [Mycena rosella]